MAENKKSFILYADQAGLFGKLSDAKAGKLIKLIFDYVNDKSPVPEDLLLSIAFEPIKVQLKRDLQKWENFKVKQAQNGKLGGRPKNPKNPSLLEKTQKSLNVNDNVNVNDRENTPPPLFRIEECLTVAMNDPRWVKANNVTAKDLQEFNRMLEKRGIYDKNPADYKTHYSNWSTGGRKDDKEKTKEEKEHEKVIAKMRGEKV